MRCSDPLSSSPPSQGGENQVPSFARSESQFLPPYEGGRLGWGLSEGYPNNKKVINMQQGAPSKGFRASLQRAYHFLKHPDQERAAGERASALNTQGKPAPRQTYTIASQQRSNRAAAADLFPFQEALGAGAGWARSELGAYYATSVSVYSAIKLRADTISRPTAQVYRQTSGGVRRPVGPDHPVQQLLEQVNRWHTRGDLWRATEIYLNLWGSAFWALERDEEGRREIWPLRPDRVSILPDRRQYIRGFVYQGRSGPVAYTPDEIV